MRAAEDILCLYRYQQGRGPAHAVHALAVACVSHGYNAEKVLRLVHTGWPVTVVVLCITLLVPCAILLPPALALSPPMPPCREPTPTLGQPRVRPPEDIFQAIRKGTRTHAALPPRTLVALDIF